MSLAAFAVIVLLHLMRLPQSERLPELRSMAGLVLMPLFIPLIDTHAWATMLNPGYQAPFGPLRAMLP